jgi:rod shape-determining protein MreC
MVALLLGNFLLMAFDARDKNTQQRVIRVWGQTIADIVQSPVSTVSGIIKSNLDSLVNLRQAEDENFLLKQRVQELEVEVQGTQTISNENERLKTLLKLKEENKSEILPAKIIGRDPSTWFDAATINRGSLSGIELYMPIITNDGLAGRITAVSPLTSQFMLLSDDKSAAAAVIGQLGTSNAVGVVRGTGEKGLLEMKYVPGNVPVQIGEIVYTTGQEGIYPPNLKLGEVIEVRAGSASVPQTIFIMPSAKIHSLQEVAVLLYKAPPRQKFEQVLPNAIKETMANSNVNVNNNKTATNSNENR